METDVIAPAGLADTRADQYSQARVEGRRVYVSGMVGRDEQFRPVGPDIESQAWQAFANIETILEAAGCGLGDVSTVTSYLVDAQQRYPDYERVWKDVFDSEPYPCHTAVGVAELVREGFFVEIDVEARLPRASETERRDPE